MATQNIIDAPLFGYSGTGNFIGSLTPTITTPNLIGVTNGSNAASGSVGELISSIIASGIATSLVNSTAKNITSISLSAGDYDTWGNVGILGSTTNITNALMWSSVTSATVPDISLLSGLNLSAIGAADIYMTIPYQRISISSPATLFLSVFAAFITGSVTACGGIFARRVR